MYEWYNALKSVNGSKLRVFVMSFWQRITHDTSPTTHDLTIFTTFNQIKWKRRSSHAYLSVFERKFQPSLDTNKRTDPVPPIRLQNTPRRRAFRHFEVWENFSRKRNLPARTFLFRSIFSFALSSSALGFAEFEFNAAVELWLDWLSGFSFTTFGGGDCNQALFEIEIHFLQQWLVIRMNWNSPRFVCYQLRRCLNRPQSNRICLRALQ